MRVGHNFNNAFLFPKGDEKPADKPKADSIRWGRPPRTATGRTRKYSFSNIWCRNVLLGSVKDHDKLIAHGISLLLGPRSELSLIPFGELLKMVQTKLKAEILLDQQKRDTIRSKILLSLGK